MKKIIAVLAVGFAVGCGGGVCDKAEEAAQACEDSGGDAGEISKSSCEDDLEKCSDADEKILETFFDCVIDKECAADEVLECVAPLAGLSEECAS